MGAREVFVGSAQPEHTIFSMLYVTVSSAAGGGGVEQGS